VTVLKDWSGVSAAVPESQALAPGTRSAAPVARPPGPERAAVPVARPPALVPGQARALGLAPALALVRARGPGPRPLAALGPGRVPLPCART